MTISSQRIVSLLLRWSVLPSTSLTLAWVMPDQYIVSPSFNQHRRALYHTSAFLALSQSGASSSSSLSSTSTPTPASPPATASLDLLEDAATILAAPADTPDSPDITESESTEDDEAFLAECHRLCEIRNLRCEKVKNARDLASVQNSPIRPNRLFRTGRLSEASDQDIHLFLEQLNLKTIVDLRSPTELKDDMNLTRSEVFGNFTDIVWKDEGRKKQGTLRQLAPGELPVRMPFWKRVAANITLIASNFTFSRSRTDELELLDELENDDGEETLKVLAAKFDDDDDSSSDIIADVEYDGNTSFTNSSKNLYVSYDKDRRERHFVSLMNEFKYVKGTVSKIRKRHITKAILYSPGALLSRRIRSSLKKPFLDEINGGGLPMLNELLLRFGAPGIRYVLELVADRNRHPIAFHCTAGKDRTGILAAIILALCDVPLEDIVQDYSLSANVYAEMNDHKAMVGALSQRSLDPKTFLGAPPQVMRDIMNAIDAEYGSVRGYCDWIGFGFEKQEKLRQACMDE